VVLQAAKDLGQQQIRVNQLQEPKTVVPRQTVVVAATLVAATLVAATLASSLFQLFDSLHLF
jgi:hypothetical protein